MVLREVKVYPYEVSITLRKKRKKKKIDLDKALDVNKFKDYFKLDNLGSNIVPIDDVRFLLIVDSSDNGNNDEQKADTENNQEFIFGRFIRLRKEAPRIVDLEERKEKPFKLLDSENLEEISHFVWGVQDNLLFAEYNYYAVRNFSAPLARYLRVILDKHKEIVKDEFKLKLMIEINSILDPKVFDKLKNDQTAIERVQLSIAEPQLKYTEQAYDLEPAEVVARMTDTLKGEGYWFNCALSRGKGKGFFDKKEILKLIDYLLRKKEENVLKSLHIETETAAYDLIRGLVYYPLECEMDGKVISESSDFYGQVVGLYREKYEELNKYLPLS